MKPRILRTHALLLSMVVCGSPVEAAETPGDFVATTSIEALGLSNVTFKRIELPATERPASPSAPECGGRTVGYIRPLDASKAVQDLWQVVGDSHVLYSEMMSPGADGLRISVRASSLPPESEIRIYSAPGRAVFGPYTAGDTAFDDQWWSPVAFGATLGVEIRTKAKPRPVEITSIAYIYDISEYGCHLDVACYPTWATEATAVAKMMFNCSPTTCSICTGYLLNRPANDRPWLFMTANHCISSQAAASTLTCQWNFQNTSCNGSVGSTTQTMGSVLLANDAFRDCTLLGLTQAPPAGAAFLDYDTSAWSVGDAVTGIHHPDGAFKRISFGTFEDSGIHDFDGIGSVTTWDVEYTNGTAEGGSSGSPLFASNRRVRGPLTGGDDGCAPIMMYYGRFDLAYPAFETFLGNIPDPVRVDAAFGGVEKGTVTNPFRFLNKASMWCVQNNGTVAILPGVYQENLTITRPMTLTAPSGGVTIGGP